MQSNATNPFMHATGAFPGQPSVAGGFPGQPLVGGLANDAMMFSSSGFMPGVMSPMYGMDAQMMWMQQQQAAYAQYLSQYMH